MTTNLIPLEGSPAPLEFLTKDYIDPENVKVKEREENRWRLLSPVERFRLQREADSLARQLRKAQYNQLVLKLDDLRQLARAKKKVYRQTTERPEKVKLYLELKDLFASARPIAKQLRDLKPTYELWRHYSGWLDYERKHRAELRAEARRDKEINRQMNREAKWLEQLLKSVWRDTAGCHHTYHEADAKKRITKTPKFSRSVIRPDAHYFYVMASKKTLLGWRWMLPHDVTITRLTEEDVLANMCAATKRQVTAEWSETGQLIYRVSRLDAPDALPKEIAWTKAMALFPEKNRDKLPYCIGVKESRKFVWFDFATEPHMLVAGKTQSGKSNAVNGIIATLVSTHSPSELRMVLVDMKGGIEFSHWWGLPHLLGNVVKNVDEVIPTLDHIIDIMRHREKLLTSIKAKTIADYNKRVDADQQLARILIVLDEMNTLVGLKGVTTDIHTKMALLTSLGRATGIHFIASTQHPEVAVIPGRIKTNLSVRCSGSMPNHHASEIVIDCADAARLPSIPGRFIVVVGLQKLTVQFPRITDEDIQGVIAASKANYPDVSEKLVDETISNVKQIELWDEQRCLGYAIDYMEGHLGAQKLHKLLGPDSIGETGFKKLFANLIAQSGVSEGSLGRLVRESDGTIWTVKKVKKGYYLSPFIEQTEPETIQVTSESAAD